MSSISTQITTSYLAENFSWQAANTQLAGNVPTGTLLRNSAFSHYRLRLSSQIGVVK